jgi:hypothetical protein
VAGKVGFITMPFSLAKIKPFGKGKMPLTTICDGVL